MRHMRIAAALLALAAIAGCNLIPGMTGPKVRVTGKLYAPAGQLSMVAAGAGNLVAAGGGNVVPTGGGSYILFAAAGEAAAHTTRITIKSHPIPTTTVPVVTDNAGGFAVDLSGGVYSAFTDTGNMPSILVVGAQGGHQELDAANHMVAAKVLSLTSIPDGARVLDAIAKLRGSLKQAPNAVDQASLAAAFDAQAGPDVKQALGF